MLVPDPQLRDDIDIILLSVSFYMVSWWQVNPFSIECKPGTPTKLNGDECIVSPHNASRDEFIFDSLY